MGAVTLKGGVVIGIRGLEPDDDQPTTFLVRDVEGEVHELVLEVSRMGTYAWFALPPFEIAQGYGAEAEEAEEAALEEAAAEAQKDADGEKLSNVPRAAQSTAPKKKRRSITVARAGTGSRTTKTSN